MTTTAPTPNENPKRDRFTASAREITQAHAGLMVALKEGHDAYYGSHGIVTESLEFLVELARPIAPLVEAGALLVYRVRGSGFLHHMVRNLVGTMLDIGRGRIPVDEIPKILAARSRSAAGPTAPAQGLFLHSVEYPTQEENDPTA